MSPTSLPSDECFSRTIEEAAKKLGFITKPLLNGAEHNAQKIAELCPMGIIFILSRDGISHSPREFSPAQNINNGANVLLHALLKLDQ